MSSHDIRQYHVLQYPLTTAHEAKGFLHVLDIIVISPAAFGPVYRGLYMDLPIIVAKDRWSSYIFKWQVVDDDRPIEWHVVQMYLSVLQDTSCAQLLSVGLHLPINLQLGLPYYVAVTHGYDHATLAKVHSVLRYVRFSCVIACHCPVADLRPGPLCSLTPEERWAMA